MRVDIQLHDFCNSKMPSSAELSAAVSPSKCGGANSHQVSKLSSPRTKLGKELKGKFKFPEVESKKSLTRSPKKSSSKLPIKMLKLEERKDVSLSEKIPHRTTKSGKKTSKQKSKTGDYIYGEEKKMFPFNPIYTPSVKQPTELPRVKDSDEDATTLSS